MTCHGCRLPNVTIKAVARIDKATGNYMLSSFLNATTPAWKPGVAKTFAWPSCVHRVKGAPDLLAYLNNTPYAAGCAPPHIYACACLDGMWQFETMWKIVTSSDSIWPEPCKAH